MRLRQIFEKELPPQVEEEFGRVLFGDWQYAQGLRPDHEKDTEYEKMVYHEVVRWFKGAADEEAIQHIMQQLSSVQEYYPTLLKPDSSSRFPWLYRSVASMDLKKQFIGKFSPPPTQRKKLNFKSRMRMRAGIEKRSELIINAMPEPVQYKPRQLAESWTVSLQSAIDIQVNYFLENPKHIVIFQAPVPDAERLFKLKFTMKMFTNTKEFEVIRVSNRPINAMLYYLEV